MLAEVRSLWDSRKQRPNVYFVLKPQNAAEKALLRALYSLRGKVSNFTDGILMIDFYPQGAKRG